MRTVLITGLNGTLAPHVARAAETDGWRVIGWDRAQCDPATASTTHQRAHLNRLAPDAILHLAMGSPDWAFMLAQGAAQRGCPYVFTSTAMVFDASSDGPHLVNDARTARDDYGRYKIACENAVLEANPASIIARIGYQIDWLRPIGNNMAAHLLAQSRKGPVGASVDWTPAASTMADTADGLVRLLQFGRRGLAAGVHHLDSNVGPAMSWPSVAERVLALMGVRCDVQPVADYVHDQRLIPARRPDTVILPDLFDALAPAR